MKKFWFVLFILLASAAVAGVNRFDSLIVKGSGAFGTSATPDAKSVLDLVSTTKGLLPPRMTTTQRDAISSPPAGLVVFNTTTAKLNAYNGSTWDVWATKAPGEVFTTAATTCPDGSLAADGTTFSNVTYPALATALGDTYGTHSGANYYLPNGKGVFVRGAGSQTISGIAYAATQGTTYGDLMQGHWHKNYTPSIAGGASLWGETLWSSNRDSNLTADPTTNAREAITDGVNGTPRVGAETRPANIVLLYCIAY